MLETLLAPIDAGRPTGICEEDDALLEELEEIMLKYGSLHQNSIDWSKVEALCTQILRSQCKHYRVLLHLITCWLNKRDIASLLDSLQLLNGFITQYWIDGHPRPGEAHTPYRKKLVEQILFRIDQGAARILGDTNTLTAGHYEALEEACTALQQQAQQKAFTPGLKKLTGRLKAIKPAQETSASTQATSGQPLTTSSDTNSTDQTPPKLADLGDERQIKRLLLSLGDLINQQDTSDPLGYEIRRYALWSGLQSTPPLNAHGESELAPPPVDLINGYVDQMNSGKYSLELLRNIEKSVTASPFWLTGSLHTAVTTQFLGYPSAAQAILRMILALLERLPALTQAKFDGGLPYLDEPYLNEVLQLIQAPDSPHNPSPMDVEWSALQATWHELRENQGISAVLEQVEQQQRNAGNLRQQHYLKLLAAEQLQAAGLQQVGKDLLTAVPEHMKTLSVSEWEPDYLQSVQSILGER